MMDLRSIDLHLLSCFDAFMAEGSVTHAATRMKLSQPEMSNVLARMRDIFRDPLLVRTARGMLATPRAMELHVPVRSTLQAFAKLISDGNDFDAAASAAHITVAVSDYTSWLLVPHLLPLLRREAPGMEVTFVSPDQGRVREALESGDYDLMIGYLVDLPAGLRTVELHRDSFACIVAADHPVIRDSLDLAGYAAAAHVRRGTAAANPFTLEVMIDRPSKSMARGVASCCSHRQRSAWCRSLLAATSWAVLQELGPACLNRCLASGCSTCRCRSHAGDLYGVA